MKKLPDSEIQISKSHSQAIDALKGILLSLVIFGHLFSFPALALLLAFALAFGFGLLYGFLGKARPNR